MTSRQLCRGNGKKRKTCQGGRPHDFSKLIRHHASGWGIGPPNGWDVMACVLCGKRKWVEA